MQFDMNVDDNMLQITFPRGLRVYIFPGEKATELFDAERPVVRIYTASNKLVNPLVVRVDNELVVDRA